MPNTPAHKAAMHRLASDRRAAGKPSWQHKIDVSSVFHNEALTFEQRRDGIVAILRNSRWLRGLDEFDDAVEAVDGLSHAEDPEEFNGWWDEIYDAADCDRVWITTR